MITLVPMTDAEYEPFYTRLTADYAHDQVASGRWNAETALEQSAAEMRKSLPNGLATPNHYLYTIRADGIDEPVGQLWVRIQRELDPNAFILDIEIYDAYQRRGYAQGALQALETLVQGMGVYKIGLHVHAQNHGAHALYDKMGYAVTGYNMIKRLDP